MTQDDILLFPGAYTISTGLKTVAYGNKGAFVVKSPGDYTSLSELGPEITSDGEEAFKNAVKAAINACVKQKSLKPGCGLVVNPTNGKVTTSTIKWSITRNANLSDFDPRLDYDDPSTATAYAGVTVKFFAQGKLDSGGSGELTTSRYIGRVSADLTKSKIAVTFES